MQVIVSSRSVRKVDGRGIYYPVSPYRIGSVRSEGLYRILGYANGMNTVTVLSKGFSNLAMAADITVFIHLQIKVNFH